MNYIMWDLVYYEYGFQRIHVDFFNHNMWYWDKYSVCLMLRVMVILSFSTVCFKCFIH